MASKQDSNRVLNMEERQQNRNTNYSRVFDDETYHHTNSGFGDVCQPRADTFVIGRDWGSNACDNPEPNGWCTYYSNIDTESELRGLKEGTRGKYTRREHYVDSRVGELKDHRHQNGYCSNDRYTSSHIPPPDMCDATKDTCYVKKRGEGVDKAK